MSDRILHKGLKSKVMSAEAAAALIPNGAVVGMSGFTGAGYPKAVPIALAKRAVDERLKGKPLKLDVLTGASTGPEQDTTMSLDGGAAVPLPVPGRRGAPARRSTRGVIEYQDMHLSPRGLPRALRLLRRDNKIDFAVIEVTKISEDGSLVSSSSCGANNVYFEHGREDHPRGERVAGRAARGDARHLSRSPASTVSAPRSRSSRPTTAWARRTCKIDVSQGGGGRRLELPGPQRALQAARGGSTRRSPSTSSTSSTAR